MNYLTKAGIALVVTGSLLHISTRITGELKGLETPALTKLPVVRLYTPVLEKMVTRIDLHIHTNTTAETMTYTNQFGIFEQGFLNNHYSINPAYTGAKIKNKNMQDISLVVFGLGCSLFCYGFSQQIWKKSKASPENTL